jgi:two-component sensor histidine kinase
MKEFDQVLRKNNSNVETSNELVRYLHGTLQTRLSASAFRFRNSASNPEEFDFEEELRTVFSHFDLEDSMSHALVQEDLLSKLNEIVTKWDGLIQSTSDVNIDLSRLNSEKVSKICDFVNEALSNALRHGKADSATIEVRDAINDVLVEVSNNGQAVMGKSNGLGSALFDELTNSRWQIGKNPKGPGVRVSGLI